MKSLVRKNIILLILIISFQGIFGQEISVEVLDSLINNFSVDEIIAGNYDEAEKKIRAIEYSDSGLFYLTLGEIDLRRGDRDKAIMNFIISAEVSEKVAPFAFRKLGDIELTSGNLAYAVSAFRIATQKTQFENYRYFLYSKIDSLKNVFPDSLGSVIWAVVFGEETLTADGKIEENPTEIIEEILSERKITADLFDSLYSFAKEKKIEKKFLARISDTTLADNTITAKKAFQIANEMFSKNELSAASNWLHLSINRKDFNTEIERKQYLNFRTQLNYSLKNWSNVIKFGKEYMANYGETSDLLFKVGRSYRQSGNLQEAHKYYEWHIQAYPNNAATHDILWYLAWLREENHDFDSAKVLFRKLANQKPAGKNSEESGLRLGLLDFRQKKYDSALKEFEDFRKKFPNSSFVSASLYWTARSYTAKNDTASAQNAIKTLSDKYPLTYYDFRGRQIFGDTAVSVLKISDSLWYSRVNSVAGVTTKDSISASERLENLLLGIFLGNIGLKDEAELIFEPIENCNSRNYPMLLTLSRYYSKIGAHYRSYRLARRLYWALPSNERGEFSPEYLQLFYPSRAYAEEIDTSSVKFGVEPQLVRGVMRQESMFSPTILSPVGAMGLMQVMPATGREIAKELDIPFEQSNLLIPQVSVEFGSFYLGKRLRQFDENFVMAIASYNGGAHNVQKWIKLNEDVLDDIPFFVECVGFSETRKYVKLVLENYWIYKRI